MTILPVSSSSHLLILLITITTHNIFLLIIITTYIIFLFLIIIIFLLCSAPLCKVVGDFSVSAVDGRCTGKTASSKLLDAAVALHFSSKEVCVEPGYRVIHYIFCANIDFLLLN